MNSIFSAERVNTGRQLEFDLVKAVTIVLMIWTHTYEALSTGFEPSLSEYYCISWVIIQFIFYFSIVPEALSTDVQVVITWLCILAATILAAVIYSNLMNTRIL